MTPVVEKVARALCAFDAVAQTEEELICCVDNVWPDYANAARVVIMALASNVTDEMGRVARTAWYRRGACGPDGETQDMRDAIAKALRSALTEGEKT